MPEQKQEGRPKAPSTIGEWDDLIASMSEADLLKYAAALRAIREWPEFNEAFKWTRCFVLIDSIQYEMERRARAVWVKGGDDIPAKVRD